jgi:hypothetical protein
VIATAAAIWPRTRDLGAVLVDGEVALLDLGRRPALEVRRRLCNEELALDLDCGTVAPRG